VAEIAEGNDLVPEATSSVARIARWWLSKAKASMSSREIFHFSAIISAPLNCDTSPAP